MMENDIKLRVSENEMFKLRSSLILYTDSNTILVQKKHHDLVWSLIGGKVRFGESTKDAIIREIHEELNYPLLDEKLSRADVFEIFWTKDSTTIHEINFIYQYKDIVKIDLDGIASLTDNQWLEMRINGGLYQTKFEPEYLKNLITSKPLK